MGSQILHTPLACPLAPQYRGAIAVIGNLDGVHLGHQALIKSGVERARSAKCPSAVVVFDPHPRRAFSPDTSPFILTHLETKARRLGALGVDYLFVLPFNEELRTQTPQTFVQYTLHEVLGIKGILTGEDFKFGAGRSGDVQALARLARDVGMSAKAITPVLSRSDEKYSSSHIRAAIREGRMEEATAMLGRPFEIRGHVQEGQKLARSLNFPTANISLSDYVRPQYGVYVVSAEIDGTPYHGVANIGLRPTVDGHHEWLEVHLFEFDGDLYGRELDVSIHHFLRPEMKFDGLDALKLQIASDAEDAQRWWIEHAN